MAPADPLVSVLVTVYNRGKFLRENLASILQSSFQDFDVIIVDDGSTDDSLSSAREFAERDKRLKVFRNDSNLGDYPNRNKAASYATGKYIKFLDADDVIYPHGLSVMIEAMEEHPEAALALSSNVIDPTQPYPIIYSPSDLYHAHFLGRSPLGAGPSASIMRRSSFESVGGFSGKQFVGDSELWLKLGERWPIVAIPPALVWWRRHEDQQMGQEQSKPEILTVRFRLELEMLERSSWLSETEKQQARNRLEYLHSRRILSMALKQRKLHIAKSLFNESGLSLFALLKGLNRSEFSRLK